MQIENWLEINIALFSMRLLTALAMIAAGLVLARIAGGALERALFRTPLKTRRLMVEFLSRTVRLVIFVIAAVMALAELGLNVMPLVAGLGVGGLVLGFAFKDSLSNLAAGLLLLFYQPFELGDFVEAGGQTGTVLAMSIVATELRLADGRLGIVPNSKIWGSAIINFNRLGQRRIEWTVGVAYGADVDQALRALREAVTADPRVLSEPAPQFLANAFSESSIDLVARAWVAPANFGDVTSDVRKAIKQNMETRGIEIPFPHRVVIQKTVP